MPTKPTFGVITEIRHIDTRNFIGDEITLSGKYTFRFPSIFPNEFKVGRRIFFDFTAWPQETSCVFIHIFKSDDEMKKECDGTVFANDICYVKSHHLLKEFIPWAT